MSQIPPATRAVRARVSKVRKSAQISDLEMSHLVNLVAEREELMARQVVSHGLAYLSVENARGIVRKVKGYDADRELTYLEEQLVTAVVCEVATDFRQLGYVVGNRRGLVVSFV